MTAPLKGTAATDTAARWGEAAQAMYRAAQAVSRPGGPQVFADLVRELGDMLHVATTFVAVYTDESRSELRTLAAMLDGQPLRNFDYALEGSPCAQVIGHAFRHVAQGVSREFKPDTLFAAKGMDSYAAFPLFDSGDQPLGLLVAMDRRPIADAALAEALLKIFAARIVAEIERLHADIALRRSEASYRAIFESAEDAIFVHDWHSGAVLDANPKACATFGYSLDELQRASLADLSSGIAPYTGDEALRHIEQARHGEHPVFEWHRRNKDGSLHWDEVRLKPAMVDGRPHVLAFTRDITEHKNALAALQAQQQKYRAIFDGSVDAMVLWSQDLRVIDINDAFVRLTGLTREQVVDRNWSERPDLDDMQRLLPVIQRALDGEEARAIERVSRADGSRFDIELRYLPVRLGGVPYALGLGRDVSAQLEHEEELVRHAAQLRDSEAQYRAIFNASADALVLRDAAFRIVDVNATYETMSGYTRDDVLGVDRVLANPPEAWARIRALHARALAGQPIALDTQLLRRDGRRYELELRGVPIQHRGAPHVLYIGRDITQAKSAERALRDSEEQYRAIFNASADALVLRDANYRAVEVNPAYTTISGYSRDEVMGADHVLTQADDEMRHRHRAWHELALGGQELSFEVTATRKDGAQLLVDVRGMPMMYRGRRHVLYATRDITERRAAEQRRGELERQLRQAQKMEAIGQLTGGIAHDFNNILTAVIGYVALGQERAAKAGDATLVRQLDSANLAAQRARDLIAQMLTFARRQPGEHRALLLAPLVRQSLKLLRSTLPATVVLESTVGEVDDPTMPVVRADAVQFEQVLFNLCINARDAMQGNGCIRIGLQRVREQPLRCASCGAAAGAGPWVALDIADTGPGIAPDVMERMFEPFFSTKEIGRGSGMGLAMVHGIVHNHGGHVVVDSEPGRGARFRVLWPVAEETATTAPARVSAAQPTPRLLGRALVVEDESPVGDMMAELLDSWGLQVVLMRDPLQACSWLDDDANTLDVLITDHTMPRMTGLQLAQRARATRPRLSVLLYSGNHDIDEAEVLQRHGVRALLRKPIDPQALRALLQRWLAP